ncbi:MAG: threonine synthase [Candidatus Bathyarchaeota archaeon]|nr:threonine synthase [Candidatus Bathyarchaeota archaeon]
MFTRGFQCLSCQREYSESTSYICPACQGIFDITYDYECLAASIDKQVMEQRSNRSIWRYKEFLPVQAQSAVTLGEGCTPLIHAPSLGDLLDITQLRLKLDFTCPTGSFKDRGASVMISRARQTAKKVAIDSSGNAAAAVSGYAARAGLDCYVFAPSYASIEKLIQSLWYGATVFAVQGTRLDTYETAKAAYQQFNWHYCGFQTNPYAIEGLKTVAYELCEQHQWQSPDYIVIPVGSGGNLIGCWKGLSELHRLNWIPQLPRIICIQPDACAPLSTAYATQREIQPVIKPKTIAEGLMITNPLRAQQVFDALDDTNGLTEIVSDQEILEASQLLARTEGIFVEPSAAVSLAGIKKLRDAGRLSASDEVVCILTGSGLKSAKFYTNRNLQPIEIAPGLLDVKRYMQAHVG